MLSVSMTGLHDLGHLHMLLYIYTSPGKNFLNEVGKFYFSRPFR